METAMDDEEESGNSVLSVELDDGDDIAPKVLSS